jgi:uncharacterized protein (TIGR00269 family)
MLSYDDHLAVALSGGKDSLSLLYILSKLSKRFPQSKISAITIDEGIEGYRDEAIELAKDCCEKLEIEQIVLSFKELFGITLDELIKGKKSSQSACSYCGTLRRRAIDKAGKAVGADKVATAHNLDDEVQTFMLNIFHGGVERITRSANNAYFVKNAFVRKIKPMCEIYEKEIALYAFLTDTKFQSIPCPYAHSSLRNDIRRIINNMEENHLGIKYTLYGSKEKLATTLNANLENFKPRACDICGFPASSKICEVCKILKNESSQPNLYTPGKSPHKAHTLVKNIR